MKDIKKEIKEKENICMDKIADAIRITRNLMILNDKINNRNVSEKYYNIYSKLESIYKEIKNEHILNIEESYIFENVEEILNYDFFIENYVKPSFINYEEEIKLALKYLDYKYPLDDTIVNLIYDIFKDYCDDYNIDYDDPYDIWGKDIEDIFYDSIKEIENKNYKGNKLNESINDVIDEISSYILNRYDIDELSHNEICDIIFNTYKELYSENFQKDNKTLLREIINQIYKLQVG